MIASAVRVQMMTESMSGSHIAVKPSVAGREVFTAECAIPAEPTPAAFENSARWMPTIATPMMPPAIPSPVNAPWNMRTKALGIAVKFSRRMMTTDTKYRTAMSGVIAEVQRAIEVMPPRITMPASTAMRRPMSQSLSAKKLASPPVEFTRMAADWLAWNRLPAPNTPTTVAIA